MSQTSELPCTVDMEPDNYKMQLEALRRDLKDKEDTIETLRDDVKLLVVRKKFLF